MNQAECIQLAQRGNVEAIAVVLAQALGDETLQLYVDWHGAQLIVDLEANPAPVQAVCAKAIQAVLIGLNIPQLQQIHINAYQAGVELPVWQVESEIARPLTTQVWQLVRRLTRSPQLNLRSRPRRRRLNWVSLSLALVISFIVGISCSQWLYAQHSQGLLSRSPRTAPDLMAIAPAPETVEPAPPPSAKTDLTLLDRNLPYLGAPLAAAQSAPSSAPSPTPTAATPAPSPPPAPAIAVTPIPSPSPAPAPTTTIERTLDMEMDPAASPAPRSTPTAMADVEVPYFGEEGATPAPRRSPVTEIDSAAGRLDNTLVIKAVGDIIPGTNYPNNRLTDRMAYLFSDVQPYLGETDILFGNFESTLTDYPHSAKDTSQGMTFAFRTPPHYAGLLKSVGFDVLSVANNHSWDFHLQGFNDTIKHIEDAGMRAVGRQGEIVYVTANGIKTAFIGFSYFDQDHNSMHDLAAGTSLVQEAKQNADVVVISVHAGAEGTDAAHTYDRTEYFYSENRGNLVLFAHAMVDAGADLVLGHGPHVPRAMELYGDRLIAYSLGNFMGYRTLSTVGTLGNSLILQAQLDRDGTFQMGRIIPVALDDNGVPYIDDYFRTVAMVRDLTRSDFPNTPLFFDDKGYIRRVE